MKTQFELHFEEAIAAMISSNSDSVHNQIKRFLDFHRNSCDYYDIFCDSLFALASGSAVNSLWITPSGESYLAFAQHDADDQLLLTHEQLPEFSGDLKIHLETALELLRDLSKMSLQS